MLVGLSEPYPQRLISSLAKVLAVSEQVCSDCMMIHRSKTDLYTIGQEIDPEIINFERFCGLSVNALLCKVHPLSSDCSTKDVKYVIIGNNKKELIKLFTSDEQIPEIDEIEYTTNESLKVIGFKKGAIEAINGNYPFSKKGSQQNGDEPYKFKIEVEYKPNPTNVFHYEVTLYGNHPKDKVTAGEFHKLKGKASDKRYLNSIISKIKNRIINNEFLFEVK